VAELGESVTGCRKLDPGFESRTGTKVELCENDDEEYRELPYNTVVTEMHKGPPKYLKM
jgi:hypothetical protein